MTTTITPTGWLIAGAQRVLLSTLERYEQREGKVLLYGSKWSLAIDCMQSDAAPAPDGSPVVSRPLTEDEINEAKNLAWAEQTAKAVDDAAALIAALDAFFTPPAP